MFYSFTLCRNWQGKPCLLTPRERSYELRYSIKNETIRYITLIIWGLVSLSAHAHSEHTHVKGWVLLHNGTRLDHHDFSLKNAYICIVSVSDERRTRRRRSGWLPARFRFWPSYSIHKQKCLPWRLFNH